MGIDEMRNMLKHYMTSQGHNIDDINKATKQIWPKSETELANMTEEYRKREKSRYTLGLEFAEWFPLLCKVFVNTNYIKEDPEAFFRKPYPALTKIFQNIKSNNKHQFCALVLCTIFDGKFHNDLLYSSNEISQHQDKLEIRNFIMSTYSLKCPDDLEDLRCAFNSLTDIYISQVGNTYKIAHSLFHDIVTYLYDDPIFVFNYGTSQFIHDRVRLEASPLHDPYVIVYTDDKNIGRLADRLIKDLKTYTRLGFELVINNPNIDNEKLISRLKAKVCDREQVDKKLVDELFLHCMKTLMGNKETYKDGEIFHYKLIKLCIDVGVDCNMSIIWGRYPIHISAVTGSLQLTKLLLANGADKRRVVMEHHSVLHWICRYTKNNRLEMVKLIMEHEGDQSVVRVTSNKSRISREVARDSTNVQLVKVLPDNSIEVLTSDKDEIYNYVKSFKGKLQLVRRIHDNILTHVDGHNRNILHYSVGDVAVTRYLLGYKEVQKVVNQLDKDSKTPYWYVENKRNPFKKTLVLNLSTQDERDMKKLYQDNHASLSTV